VVIPNGIDLARWQPLAADLARAAEWRRATVEVGAARRRVLGFFGHVKRKKGALFLLDNLRRADLTGRFHVRFVGELDGEVAAWLERHGGAVAHDVEPFGDRYGLLARYPSCDLVALPSFYDGTPNVMVEAAALGIPMLAARTGGMADLLEDGRHAFLFAPGSDEEAVAALRRAAAAEDTDLARMGDACRELARDRLDHRQETAAYVEVLRAVGTSQAGALPAE
jgi:glycosyltransferase involved in cell wall biosynthesis